MLEPYLESKGLADKATQVLVYFAVAKLGEKPTDGITDMNPEGLTAANGKWAEEASNRFNNVGLSCKVLDKKPFMAAMFEKLIWICSFMVIGAMHAPCTVGGVETNHTEEVTALINEMAAAVPDVEFEPQLPERLLAYARSVAHFPTAVKEFEWRNGFFNNLSKQAYKKGIMKDPLPLHSYYLNVLGVGKPIPFPFQNYKSFMTQEEEEAQHELLTRFEAKRARRLARRARKKAEAEEMKKRELEKAESAKLDYNKSPSARNGKSGSGGRDKAKPTKGNCGQSDINMPLALVSASQYQPLSLLSPPPPPPPSPLPPFFFLSQIIFILFFFLM
ncbi:hypothetical protein AAMO2058_000071400 [Amorphochlora amoebiformis]